MLIKLENIERDLNVIGVQLRITNKKYRILYKVISEEVGLVNVELGMLIDRRDSQDIVYFKEFGIIKSVDSCPEGWSFQKEFDCRNIPVEDVIPKGLEM